MVPLAHKFYSKWHLDRFCRFARNQHIDRQTDRQTDRRTERSRNVETSAAAVIRIYHHCWQQWCTQRGTRKGRGPQSCDTKFYFVYIFKTFGNVFVYLNFITVFLCSTFCYVLIQLQLFDDIAWYIAKEIKMAIIFGRLYSAVTFSHF